MDTDITRQISASVYENSIIRDKIYSLIKDSNRAIVESSGIDSTELLGHVLNSRRQERNYYFLLCIPSIILLFLLSSISNTSEYDPGAGKFTLAFLLFIVIFVIVLIKDFDQRSFLKKNFSKNLYNPSFNFNHDEKSTDLINNYQKRTGKNIAFYSGYSPFVGSGIDIGGWSFVVDIDRGKKNFDTTMIPDNFQEKELYDALTKEINDLGFPSLVIKDKIFVNGRRIRDNRDLLPNILEHPVNAISQDYVDLVMNNDIKDARHYKVLQVTDWGGDLILTSFLRFKKNEKNLFVENNYFLLPPIDENFKKIDAEKEYSGIKYFVERSAHIVVIAVGHSLLSIMKVYGYTLQGISDFFGMSEEAQMKKIVRSSPDFDYGANTSIREAVSQTNYTQHFQKLDKERYFKIIEKRIFNLIGDFLDNKNIDTSEFKERETSVLNHGVIVTGGNLSGQNIVVGQKSNINLLKKKG